MYQIPVTRTDHPKKKPEDEHKLGFGEIFTDHMFIMDYELAVAGTTPVWCPMARLSWILPARCFIMRRRFSRA